MKLLSIPRIPSTILSRFTIWCAGVFAMAQGVGCIVGGSERWVGPAYTTIRQIAVPEVWGLFIFFCGVLTIFSSILRQFYLKAVALIGISAWSTMFSFGSFSAMFHIPTVGTTGGPTYLYIACTVAILICVDETRFVE